MHKAQYPTLRNAVNAIFLITWRQIFPSRKSIGGGFEGFGQEVSVISLFTTPVLPLQTETNCRL